MAETQDNATFAAVKSLIAQVRVVATGLERAAVDQIRSDKPHFDCEDGELLGMIREASTAGEELHAAARQMLNVLGVYGD